MFTASGQVSGTFDFSGNGVDLSRGSYSLVDGLVSGEVSGSTSGGTPVSAAFQARANGEEMVMIFQDNENHVVGLTLSRAGR